MTAERTYAEERRVPVQGQIMEALAERDTPMTGTLDRLARRFSVTPDDLRVCLLDLARAGWISILIQPFGRVTIQVQYAAQAAPPVVAVGCRSVPDAWRL